MLTALRQAVQRELLSLPVRRKPALRRTDAEGFLLATDLPLTAEEAAVEAFIRRMTELGWRVLRQGSWLQLDCPVPVPVTDAFPACGECACCISLLERHPEDGDAAEYIRRVVKAADAGRQPFERLCIQLHGEFAAMLRQHQPLPGALLPYLYSASRSICEN